MDNEQTWLETLYNVAQAASVLDPGMSGTLPQATATRGLSDGEASRYRAEIHLSSGRNFVATGATIDAASREVLRNLRDWCAARTDRYAATVALISPHLDG